MKDDLINTNYNEFFDAKKAKNEIVGWIRDYFEENGKGCHAVVGISGGKDSSIVAALCVEALGKDRVVGVLMPKGEQFDIDVSYALCEELGMRHYVFNIGQTVDSLYQELSYTEQNDLSDKPEKIELNSVVVTNTPARIRMTVLYAVSASVGGRVANTCNLSEDYVGFATKFGDGAGDFSPLSDFTVAEIKAIGRELKLSGKFVDKVPIDGLTDKTDEENFGFTYEVLDRYIRTGVCEDKEIKEKIDHMHKINLHKVLPMPKFKFKI